MLVMVPATVGRTARLSETTPPLARVGQVANTVPALLLAETKATPGGKAFVSSSPLALDGPRLVTNILLVKLTPAKTWFVAVVWATARSAMGRTVVVLVAVLLVAIGSISNSE